MTVGVLLPILAFVVMGTLVAAVLWRVMVVGGRARRSAQGLRAASYVAHRADRCMSALATDLEGLRQRRMEPAQAGETLIEGSAALSTLVAEARAARTRTDEPAVASLIEDLERAARSLELIDHGCQLILGGGDDSGQGETTVKRGYLNLLHAQDAIRQRGAQIRMTSAPPAPLRAVGRH